MALSPLVVLRISITRSFSDGDAIATSVCRSIPLSSLISIAACGRRIVSAQLAILVCKVSTLLTTATIAASVTVVNVRKRPVRLAKCRHIFYLSKQPTSPGGTAERPQPHPWIRKGFPFQTKSRICLEFT